ncbi:MAG: hypothetical protein GX988_04840 [Clostridiales bacterium]|nr:hypothetical protein [Clostridiales bacterium]
MGLIDIIIVVSVVSIVTIALLLHRRYLKKNGKDIKSNGCGCHACGVGHDHGAQGSSCDDVNTH